MAQLTIWLLFLLSSLQASHAASSRIPISFSPTPSTCPHRTVNYITHSLPRQCLTSSRSVVSVIPTETTTSNTVTSSTTTELSEILDLNTSLLKEIQGASNSTSVEPSASPSSELTATAHSSQAAPSLPVVPFTEITDEESALESGNFLSYEEWKKQNLRKVGQSEHVGKSMKPETQEPRKRPTNFHNSLDSLGDDAEIDLDFSGLVPGGPGMAGHGSGEAAHHVSEGRDEAGTETTLRTRSKSEEAGKTSKERFNYASFDCAANVLKSNSQAKGPNAVLSENKDAYMLNECSAANKFLILELCEDISIDTVVLANFEFFSSTFRVFSVSVSDRYPVKVDKWRLLGTFEARNTREVQAFLIENSVIWARYIRIEFLSHYGSEFYCPVSLVRVHGTTMLEEYKHDMDMVMTEETDDGDGETFELEQATPVDGLPVEAVAEPILKELESHSDLVSAASLDQKRSASSIAESSTCTSTLASDSASVSAPDAADDVQSRSTEVETPASLLGRGTNALASSLEPTVMCSAEELETESRASSSTSSTSSTSSQPIDFVVREPSTRSSKSTATESSKPVIVTKVESSSRGSDASHVSSRSSKAESSSMMSHPDTADQSVSPGTASPSSRATDANKPPTSSSERSKTTSTATQAQPALPTMQESFFKLVQKRLQMLESNSSLSLQYIEDQSRALREAFKKVEQRQLAKTTKFLDQLNATVLNELREFRQQYDQLWQSTIIELEMHRERYETDNEAINARLGVLADEVIFQRRMDILQMVLLLVCLMLVLFSRGAIPNYLELPLVQNVLSRSPSSRWLNTSSSFNSEPHSPSRNQSITGTRSAHQLHSDAIGPGILKGQNHGQGQGQTYTRGHARLHSEESTTSNQSPSDIYSSQTPTSYDGQSEAEVLSHIKDGRARSMDMDTLAIARVAFDQQGGNSTIHDEQCDDRDGDEDGQDGDTSKFGDPEFDPSMIERPSTSPPVLPYAVDKDGEASPSSPLLASSILSSSSSGDMNSITGLSVDETIESRMKSLSNGGVGGTDDDPIDSRLLGTLSRVSPDRNDRPLRLPRPPSPASPVPLGRLRSRKAGREEEIGPRAVSQLEREAENGHGYLQQSGSVSHAVEEVIPGPGPANGGKHLTWKL